MENQNLSKPPLQNGIIYPDREIIEPKYEKLKSSISVREFLAESHTDPDITLRSPRSGDLTVSANRIVLAAVSPFFKMCLAGVEDTPDTVNITITDSCHESLTHLMTYIYNGAVTITDQIMREKVQNLIGRLQIGDFSIGHLEKLETSEDFPLVKSEPGGETENNAVSNYYNYIDRLNKQNESQALKRKRKADNGWKSQVINSLYKDEGEDEEEGDDFDEEAEVDDYYSEDDDEYEKPKSKAKSGSSVKKSRKQSEKRFKCEHCPKTFSRASDKRIHEEIHSKPYKCDECDASFGRKSNLIGHMR